MARGTTVHRLRWAGKFFRQGRTIASLTPSSRWLARAMCRDVDASRPQTIVELGAGVGPVTAMVQQRMHPQSTFLSIELDPELHEMASQRCPNVDIQLGSAVDLDQFLNARGIEDVDCMISCLPIPSMPKAVNASLFACYQRRCPLGAFAQITQIPWYYRRIYLQSFEQVEFDLVMMNFLPAGVYHCRNLRSNFNNEATLPGH
jgi:phospholipid N-methyltransferase